MKLRAFCDILEKIATTRFAAKWDNVGLLVEPAGCIVKNVLLTNDLTEKVMQEAILIGANVIISYHPPLFKEFKRISQNNWKDRLVTQALQHQIAIYSPHTAHDAWSEGVNTWLISAVTNGEKTLPISPSSDGREMYEVSGSLKETANMKLFKKTFRKINIDEDGSLSGWIYKRDVPKFSEHIGSIENAKFSVLAGLPEEGTGMGRKVKLEEKITLKESIEKTKQHLKLDRIRLVLGINHNMESEIGVVAVCAGSGASILTHAGNADLWITGEMSHHEALDAQQNGVSVLLCEHSNTERGFLSQYQNVILSDQMIKKAEINVTITSMDRDPIEI